MQYTLGDIATRFNLALHGDATCVITGLARLEDAGPLQLAFLDSSSHKKFLSSTKASGVVLRESDRSACSVNTLTTDDPRLAYAKIAGLFVPPVKSAPGIHESSVIGTSCQIADTASIAAHCVIGDNVTIADHVCVEAGTVIGDNVTIGASTHFFPHVTVYHGVRIGANVTIHSGAVIGSDGFGYTKAGEAWHKIPQLGTVIVHDDVDIGAGTVIDRGALGDTVIGRGVILDNLIQIAHNVIIGDYTAIAGCTGIAGSARIGKHCSIGGGTCMAGHIEIADYVILTGMSMVTNSIKKSGVYSSGTGLQGNLEWKKSVIRFQQSAKLVKRVQALEKKLAQD